jgi:hypothetical protein
MCIVLLVCQLIIINLSVCQLIINLRILLEFHGLISDAEVSASFKFSKIFQCHHWCVVSVPVGRKACATLVVALGRIKLRSIEPPASGDKNNVHTENRTQVSATTMRGTSHCTM